MTKRKFTPPTTFPAEYVDGDGETITLIAKGKGRCPYVGQDERGSWFTFTEDGSFDTSDVPSNCDLHDLPKKQIHWANDYDGCITKAWWASREDADAGSKFGRIAVIRREWVEGELPRYFVEEV